MRQHDYSLSQHGNRILILSSDLMPNVSANGVCISHIAKEYVKRGYEVYCLTQRTPGQKAFEIVEGIHIYRVKAAWFSTFYAKYSNGGKIARVVCSLVHYIRNVCLIPFYPNVSPWRSRRFFTCANRIVKNRQINIVIGAYRPYEAIYATTKLKYRYRDKLYCISYYLDVMTTKKNGNKGQSLLNRAVMRSQRRDIHVLDRVCIPVANKSEFEELFGNHSNVAFVEFPMYISDSCCYSDEYVFPEDELSIVYIGTLNKTDRNPERLLTILQTVQRHIPRIRLHISGNVVGVHDILDMYPSLVVYHGYLDSKYTLSVLKKADWVLNVGNKKNIKMVPSKIFQLFASGRPIINYVFDEEDISLPYLGKYKNVVMLYDAEGIDIACNHIVKEMQIERVTVNADRIFADNTPCVVAKRIIGETNAREWIENSSDS